MQEPGSMISLGRNAKFWNGLSKADQAMIEAAAGLENDMMMSEYNAKSGEALADLVKNQGVKLRKFNDDVYDSFKEASDAVFEGVRAHSPLAAKIHASFLKARADLSAWSKISDQALLVFQEYYELQNHSDQNPSGPEEVPLFHADFSYNIILFIK